MQPYNVGYVLWRAAEVNEDGKPEVVQLDYKNPAAGTILEQKRRDDTFRRQFNEKPSIIPGCPAVQHYIVCLKICNTK